MIHLVGVDGVGKSSVLESLKQEGISVLRVPQFHVSVRFSAEEESKLLEKVSQLSDQRDLPALKACILFLAMTLFQRAAAENPELEVSERFPLLEALLYTPVYLKLLEDPAVLIEAEAWLRGELSGEEQRRLESLIGDASRGQAHAFPGFAAYLHLNLSSGQRRSFILSSFGDRAPDHVVLLKADATAIQDRLAKKIQSGAHAEYHEKSDILMQLQAGYEKLLPEMGIDFTIINTTGREIPEVRDLVLKAVLANRTRTRPDRKSREPDRDPAWSVKT